MERHPIKMHPRLYRQAQPPGFRQPSGTEDSDAPPTCLYFSSYKIFSEILDNPEAAGHPSEDVKEAGGSIWQDHLNATAAVHKDTAHEFAKVVRSVEVVSGSA
jgi:hypothetical protein